jgi:hypothetical protein
LTSSAIFHPLIMSGWKVKRKRGADDDPKDEIIDELHAAIDTCARAAEMELRQHPAGGEMLQLLPDLVESLKDQASGHPLHKLAASALRDLALLTCKSRASELAKRREQERAEFAAATQQDREELKAIEARIREIRKETAAERRSLQDFQNKAMACTRQYRDLHKRRLHPLLKAPTMPGDSFIDDPKAISLPLIRAEAAREKLRSGAGQDVDALGEESPLVVDDELAEIAGQDAQL